MPVEVDMRVAEHHRNGYRSNGHPSFSMLCLGRRQADAISKRLSICAPKRKRRHWLMWLRPRAMLIAISPMASKRCREGSAYPCGMRMPLSDDRMLR